MNFIDIVVLVVIGISALIALSSGFVNVVLWILSWVVAVFATVYFFPTFQPMVAQHISDALIANIVTAVAIFLVALILCTIVNQVISRIVRASPIGALDRSLGFVFGLVIGAALVCGAYMLMVFVVPDRKDWPQPVQEARTLPLVERGAALIRSMVPDYVIEKGTAAIDQGIRTLQDGKAATDTINKVNPEPGSGGETPNPAPAPAPSPDTGQTQGSNANPGGNPDGQQATTGYKDAQRNDLNRLIESSQQ
ncbi:MAG TPA: CvpA family protein [Dongiaceae bacterium]|nr:CvpA family protein [Dongiaceae bacterium]